MPHIVKSFDEELTKLHERLAQMGELARAQFHQAIEALISRDDGVAAAVVARDADIDRLNDELNEQVVRVLALRSPMADDLRLVITALKAAGDLERTGDYAASVAKRTAALRNTPPLPSARTVQRMGAMVESMIGDVLDAYRDRDAQKAMDVWLRDREVDELYSSLFRELLTYMMEDPRYITPCSHLMFIAKNIERVGDHVTNIAEMIYFLATGHPIEGIRPKGDTTSDPGA